MLAHMDFVEAVGFVQLKLSKTIRKKITQNWKEQYTQNMFEAVPTYSNEGILTKHVLQT